MDSNRPALFLVALVVHSMLCSSRVFPQGSSVGTGAWGGNHIALDVTATGARVEFDCAHGTLDEQLALDRAGKFKVKGSFATEAAGPVRRNRPEQARPARYDGRLSDSTLTLTVILADSNETIGVFTLTRDKPRITKCR